MLCSLIEELQACYATTTAVNPYKSFKPPPVVADEKFLFDWDDQVGNAFDFELGEDDMPEGNVEGEEPVFELLSGVHLCLPACCSTHLPNLYEQHMLPFTWCMNVVLGICMTVCSLLFSTCFLDSFVHC